MDDPVGPSILLRLLSVVALVAANAFFVAAEFALVAARRTRIEAMVRRGDRRAKAVQRALGDLSRQLSAAQLGITVASILLGYVAEETVAEVFRNWFAGVPPWLSVLTRGGVASVTAVSVVSFLHVVFGEQAPKAWAITYPESTSRWIAGPLLAFAIITKPLTDGLNWCANMLVRLLGIKQPPGGAERVHSPEEILMLIQQSGQTGDMDPRNARMIEGVFEFTEKLARDVMTPRTAIVGIPVAATLAQAADRVAQAGRSRYPVHGETLDDIAGTVHAKAILAGLRDQPTAAVATVMRPAFFVPGTREVEDVLADMKRQKVHIAIVLDEYGGTAGLVTMEDLLEEIVGPIYDEYDRQPEAAAPAAGGFPEFPGAAEIREVNEALALKLDDTDYSTIGGLVFGQLGRLPRVGDVATVKGGAFEVVAMEGRRVGKVRFKKTAS